MEETKDTVRHMGPPFEVGPVIELCLKDFWCQLLEEVGLVYSNFFECDLTIDVIPGPTARHLKSLDYPVLNIRNCFTPVR